MVYSKLFRVIFLFTLSSALISCGGGGSSGIGDVGQVPFSLDIIPDGAGDVYQGNKSPAQLNPDNSIIFLESLFGYSNELNSSNEAKKVFSKKYPANRNVLDRSNSVLGRAVDESYVGLISGTYSITGEVNDKNQGVVTYEWNNFSDEVGLVINGKSILNVLDYDLNNDIILQSTTKLVDLRTTENGRTIISNGYVVEDVNVAEQKLTSIFDMAFYDESSKLWKAFDKLKREETFSSPVRTKLTGRVYREDLGYVDVSTPSSFAVCHNCEPQHPVTQGAIRLKDDNNNTATITFINERKFSYQFVDESDVETTRDADWRELKSWITDNNPPYEPYVSIQTSPTNTQDIVIGVSSLRDPEGDVVSPIVTWKVNGNVIAGVTGTALSHEHYDATDTIEVSVVATDPYGAQSQPTVKTVTVDNTKPDIEIISSAASPLGELMTLDASGTTDVDSHPLTFNWVVRGYPEGLVTVFSPDKAKTDVSIQSNGSYQIALDVRETIRGELSDEIHTSYAYLTVLAEDIFRESEVLPESVNSVSSLQILNVTGDDNPEIVVGTPGKIQILNIANSSANSDALLYDTSYAPRTVLVEDLNNDGLLDLVVDQEEGFAVTKQETGGEYRIVPSIHVSTTPFHRTINQIQTGHFNDDDKLDVAVSFNTSVEVYLQKEPLPPSPEDEELGLHLDEDDTAFESPIVYKFTENSSITPFESTEMKVADVTGDSLDDIVLMTPLDNNSHHSLVLLKQKSTGGFEEKQVIHPEIQFTKDETLALVDLNGDQRVDILATHNEASDAIDHGAFDIFYQSSTGDFNEFETRITTSNVRKIIVKDINGDGNKDLIMNNDDTVAIHKLGADKHLSPFFNTYGFSGGVADTFGIGDINADGKLDVVSTSFGRMHVSYGK